MQYYIVLLVLLSFLAVNTQAQTNYCPLCTFVVKNVESLIASNATEEEIITTVDQLCSLIGSSDCYAFIAQYIPDLIQWIENNEDPTAFCTAAGLCTTLAKSTTDKSHLHDVKMVSL